VRESAQERVAHLPPGKRQMLDARRPGGHPQVASGWRFAVPIQATSGG
jgi:hypothetical protein